MMVQEKKNRYSLVLRDDTVAISDTRYGISVVRYEYKDFDFDIITRTTASVCAVFVSYTYGNLLEYVYQGRTDELPREINWQYVYVIMGVRNAFSMAYLEQALAAKFKKYDGVCYNVVSMVHKQEGFLSIQDEEKHEKILDALYALLKVYGIRFDVGISSSVDTDGDGEFDTFEVGLLGEPIIELAEAMGAEDITDEVLFGENVAAEPVVPENKDGFDPFADMDKKEEAVDDINGEETVSDEQEIVEEPKPDKRESKLWQEARNSYVEMNKNASVAPTIEHANANEVFTNSPDDTLSMIAQMALLNDAGNVEQYASNLAVIRNLFPALSNASSPLNVALHGAINAVFANPSLSATVVTLSDTGETAFKLSFLRSIGGLVKMYICESNNGAKILVEKPMNEILLPYDTMWCASHVMRASYACAPEIHTAICVDASDVTGNTNGYARYIVEQCL